MKYILFLIVMIFSSQFLYSAFSQLNKFQTLGVQRYERSVKKQNNELRIKKFALIIGISKYEQPTFDSLRYADQDALSFYEFLRKGYIKDFDIKNVKCLLNEEAVYSNVNNALYNWLDSINKLIKIEDQAEVYIY